MTIFSLFFWNPNLRLTIPITGRVIWFNLENLRPIFANGWEASESWEAADQVVMGGCDGGFFCCS